MYITDSANFLWLSSLWNGRQHPMTEALIFERRWHRSQGEGGMKAHQLIRNAAYDAEQLDVITDAYEGAWRAVEERFSNDAERERARTRLAKVILELASQGMMEPQLLKASAIKVMTEPLD
jgi:hypothetical protein